MTDDYRKVANDKDVSWRTITAGPETKITIPSSYGLKGGQGRSSREVFDWAFAFTWVVVLGSLGLFWAWVLTLVTDGG